MEKWRSRVLLDDDGVKGRGKRYTVGVLGEGVRDVTEEEVETVS